MGSHINQDGEFQSDKYPTCPAGKVPLSVKDPMAQDLLWEYSIRRRSVDPEFALDLEQVLLEKGFEPCAPTIGGLTSIIHDLADAAGVPDADLPGGIVARVKALYRAVIETHIEDRDSGLCVLCGADIEDALTDGMVCPHYGQTLVADDVIARAATLHGDALFQGPGTSGAVAPDGSDPTKKKAT